MFSKVLIANRGAIATRIERTLEKMGIQSVAVYSKADMDSLHVENADEAVLLGEGNAKETYLDVDKIIDAAIKTGAQAVHPGYGFLSENTDFAKRCEKNGIKFIGPTTEQIEVFGLKHKARELAKNADVPLLPGTNLITDLDEAVEAADTIGYPVILKSTAGGGGIGMKICYSAEELLLPGTNLITDLDEAVEAADTIGYPVILKSTAGGGGIGMKICYSAEELKNAYDSVVHLAAANFNNAGVFLEKYIEKARHIEIQIFGNEYGEACALAERDCSVQRRNQKVVEESPACNIKEEVKRQMYDAAESLAREVGYRSAGTVEFLYDVKAEQFYFLEVNTRLQVEHGITEEVLGVDLVEWMVKEAAGELKDIKSLYSKPQGHSIVNTRLQVEHGITEEVLGVDLVEWMVKEAAGELKDIKSLYSKPQGHSIEVRVYAEDCLNGFMPSTGKVDKVKFLPTARVETWLRDNIEVTSLYDPMLAKLIVHGEDREDPSTGKVDKVKFLPTARVETWLRDNIEVTSLYDPMLAKLIVHGEDREDALHKMHEVLEESRVYGITTNLQYLNALIESDEYKQGNLWTGMLKDFHPEENAIEVIDGGIQTTIQDYPGRTGYWAVGVPPCGPMDNYAFRIGNSLLGNNDDAPGIEMTLRGGAYKFRTTITFCITGADMEAELDGAEVPMYTVISAMPGQVLKFKTCNQGMRTYLLVKGGFDMPTIMGSSSTFIDGKFGGFGGRILRTGDVLKVTNEHISDSIASVPEMYRPAMKNEWTIGVIPGPQPTSEYLEPKFLETLTTTEYEVNFNSARTGIRLNGPVPEWVREDGGEAGLHPSNIHDNPYAVGAMDLTGDQPILLGPDGPSLGGFVCPVTVANGELWKLGQLHPGDKVKFKLITLKEAEQIRSLVEKNITDFETKVEMPKVINVPDANYAVLADEVEHGVAIKIRLNGEENILVEYGEMELNIELRFRVHILMNELQKLNLPIIDLTPGIRSLQIHFDINKIDAIAMANKVLEVNKKFDEIKNITVPSRIIKLPLSWDDPQTQLAAKRYQATVRPDAPWCPSNPEFIRRINGLDSLDDVMNIVFEAEYMVLGLGDVYLGAPVATPVDPRHRMVTTKYNPARPWTPENAVGIGGAYLCVYGMEGPGGYQFVGRTVQMWNLLRETKSFTKDKPWLLNFFDRIKFYPVSADEILQMREDFLRGKFEIEVEDGTFSLAEYEKFLEENKEGIHAFKTKQETAFEAERNRWREQGLDKFISEAAATTTTISEDEEDIPEGCEAVKTTIPGAVWKVTVNEGDKVSKGDEIMILESMKTEVPIVAEFDGIINKLYLKSGDQVAVGQVVACIAD